ncbi:hypothetical protein CW975_18400 [Salmonella enterica subsp. enterica serovar Enteritidis]|uniref:Uncharacterized protein n=19 Tax=Salmonella enterica I TaxID=59201 RepID=A0A724SZY6_SALEP|nr:MULTISPECIES: hypothetical protein [Salmonella]AGS65516.1 hypothetical protein I137_08735 [Salmonella enterica subsp. enterica serovar Pullorum str. S06004]EAA6842161.1 hypothetical protein [Salmonella enterica subsp. enterica serovar Pensacola]EAA6849500.1 hypothetical protein [Salmonella enterica subsp. enterica serovar Stanleyville]EBF8250736.1 hypothetical protein [Salmonella enterica subsp. enterica serovar Eschberg]EBG2795853.1 hypothetical protein [Salmonella enterica subsp. enterica
MLALYAETRKILMSGIMETTFISGPFFYAPGDAASNLDELYVRLAELQYAKKAELDDKPVVRLHIIRRGNVG